MKKHSILSALISLTTFLFSMAAYAQDQDESITEKEQKEVIEAVGKQLTDKYVFPEMGKKMADQLKKNMKKGQYEAIDNALEFQEALTQDLQAVSKDKHIKVLFDPVEIAEQQKAQTPADKQKLKDQMVARNRMGNFGFHEVKILEGNIGYLDLRSFQGTAYASDTAVAAMNFLSNSDAIIIDLRQNGGGSPHMIQLITSYLYDEEPVHLNSFYHRPTDSHSQTWTLPHVPGKRNPNVPVYVLTSGRTFSAAEEFSYNLKNLERATLVGETTGGGAHPGGHQIATDRFAVWVPTGRAINPITNTNWEGTGVTPHIEVEQEQALNTAYTKALEELIENNPDENAQARYQWIIEGLEAEERMVELTTSEMQSYAGSYGPRVVTLENGELYYQRGEGTKYKLIPMGNHKFSIAEIPYFRIQFEHKDDQVVALVGTYDNGRTDKNMRD